MSRILEIQELGRRFGAHEVIRSLDLLIEPGGRVALRGPNGSGKTTVLRCIAGTISPTSGRISIGGHPAGTLAARRHTGVSFSLERAFYLRLTGYDNLLFFARLRDRNKRAAKREVGELKEELELDFAHERVDRCSTGMIQQLSFARALIGRPPLLLLDEPTRSLDVDAITRFWAALERRDAAVVLATHRADDVDRCDATVDLPA